MDNIKYKSILYFILVVIITTIGIQVYWNYKNYGVNKQQLINEVQISLDKAVDTYYANLAETSTIGLAVNATDPTDLILQNRKFDSIIHQYELFKKDDVNPDSFEVDIPGGIAVFRETKGDSVLQTVHRNHNDSGNISRRLIIKDYELTGRDSLAIDQFKSLTSKVIISLTQDSLDLKDIDSILKVELARKKIAISYRLSYESGMRKSDEVTDKPNNRSLLTTVSNSSFLPNNQFIRIDFTNETKEILKRILSGILISTLLVLAVISCLFYLLRIIKRQKQLAEVKNDLISNITHEFKTPIATIGVALESIKSFDVIDDKKKTRSYLDMSGKQLKKLNVMVEKLLETATLDSDNLNLVKEPVIISELLTSLTDKYKLADENKSISFEVPDHDIIANIDLFHFENALDNVLDNAIKYGGDTIKIKLFQPSNDVVTITVSDNGKSLTKVDKERIFDKFYRIPKGNTHDIKGFGIGLYYTKTIIEKHGGAINVELGQSWTSFKITIPK